MRFLIIDGYPRQSRDELEQAGMQLAWKLYVDMLLAYVPDAEYDVWLASDTEHAIPDGRGLDGYAGVLWTGCNLTVYDEEDQRVTRQIELARRAYDVGIPSFGSCWGLQVAVVAADGEVKANPKGREMGIARKLRVTSQGQAHPLLGGKPLVFDGFISHVDEVTRLPEGAKLLVEGSFTKVMAAEVVSGKKKGVFWATQYHPEYDLHEMARLMVAREPKLVPEGFFADGQDLAAHVDRLEALAAHPDRKHLRWQLAIDDDILDRRVRQAEVANWVDHLVRPTWAERSA